MCRAAVANGRGGEVVAALPRARLLRDARTASSAAVQGLRVGAIRLNTTEYKVLRAQFKEWTPCAKLSPNGEVKRQGWESLNASKYDESDITEANATLSRAILSSRISKSRENLRLMLRNLDNASMQLDCVYYHGQHWSLNNRQLKSLNLYAPPVQLEWLRRVDFLKAYMLACCFSGTERNCVNTLR